MKYPFWNEYDDEKRWKAIERELELDTHNGTTKDDMWNMIVFMCSQIRAVKLLEPMIKHLEQENTKLKRIIQENGGISSDR